MAHPIVKMPGGKTRLLPQLLKRLPERIDTYVEPFVGGGALFFALASESPRRYKRAVLCDKNASLMLFYAVVKSDVESLIAELQDFRHSRRAFERVRADFNQKGTITDRVERAAVTLYLNKTCFNGLWRVNSKGEFNVPFGKYKNPRVCDPDGLRAASKALRGVKLVAGDFSLVTRGLGARDFCYYDSPYVPLSDSSNFTAYTAGGFRLDDHARLAGDARRLRAHGTPFLLSNSDTALVRTLYPSTKFKRARVHVGRSINSDVEARGKISELLISPR